MNPITFLATHISNGNDIRRITDYSFMLLMFHREKENTAYY